MTTTVTNYPSEASSRMKTRSMPSFYPLGLTGATAGTGITGASPDFPSPSMTHKRPPQAWVVYLPRNGELENPSEIVAKIVWPDVQEQSEPDATAWRGVFAPSYNWKVLFSKPIELRAGKLPRWKPQVTIDRRTLERAEDE